MKLRPGRFALLLTTFTLHAVHGSPSCRFRQSKNLFTTSRLLALSESSAGPCLEGPSSFDDGLLWESGSLRRALGVRRGCSSWRTDRVRTARPGYSAAARSVCPTHSMHPPSTRTAVAPRHFEPFCNQTFLQHPCRACPLPSAAHRRAISVPTHALQGAHRTRRHRIHGSMLFSYCFSPPELHAGGRLSI